MTELRFHCAICGTELTAQADAAGAVKECTACGRHVPVPGLLRLHGLDCAPVFPEEILSVELKFRCTRCASKLCIDVRWEGHDVSCPQCNLRLKVPRWTQRSAEAEVAAEGFARLSPAEIEFLGGPAAPKPAVA